MTFQSSGEVAADAGVIRVHVVELRRLFNPMDPSPLRDRDLDPNAEEYIVSSGREAPRTAPLHLLVELDRPAGAADIAQLREAMHRFFATRAVVTRRRLKEMFRRGRISLAIGIAFLGAALAASEMIGALLRPGGVFDVLRESLMIGGWVAMWRPIEVFLYDWWPIHAEARLLDRLAAMPVDVGHAPGEAPNDGRA